ncbi:hypothetical protein FOS14_02860 [Skermania sp. ID1734]|uniref:COG4705 family protein n=1 Tax=Skermania sp. ID1734 TaxID=2597516 RepID=UPI001180C1A8|nr:hypothetical protein [Skermania sp. ID1734]TSE01702.1 hypothetical protein FOS14_02860 [Skermania sp. ID1734]
MLNKVPEVTVYFWIIKILATTVGETAADYLNMHLGLGLADTTLIMAGLFTAVLAWQFCRRGYVPWVYWLTVTLISVVGTLITDNLTDNLGVPLQTSTAAFTVALVIVFAAWYASERTLSIHSIVTTRREAFYWLAILVTFALGTAAGDLMGEQLHLGYGTSALIVGTVIAAIFTAHKVLGLNAVLAFWLAYILTRPLGASLGDLLAQPSDSGGLGFGTTWTTAVFLTAIVALVAYLTVSRRDVIGAPEGTDAHALLARAE